MALDVHHISSQPTADAAAARRLEHAERLKIAWRLRVTARVNLMQVLTTAEPTDPARLLRLLRDLCGGGGVDGPVCRPYCALDSAWLRRRGGGARICTSIGAGLTELLRRGAVQPADVPRVQQLAQRAFDGGAQLLRLTSASHQAMYNFHCARFCHWRGRTAEAASLARTASVNLTGQPANRVSQRDVRLEADVRVLMFEINRAPDAVLDINKLMHTLTRDRVHFSSGSATRQRDASHAEARLQRLLDGVSGANGNNNDTHPQLPSDAVQGMCNEVTDALQLLEAKVIAVARL